MRVGYAHCPAPQLSTERCRQQAEFGHRRLLADVPVRLTNDEQSYIPRIPVIIHFKFHWFGVLEFEHRMLVALLVLAFNPRNPENLKLIPEDYVNSLYCHTMSLNCGKCGSNIIGLGTVPWAASCSIGVNPGGLGVATPDFGMRGLWGLNEILLYPIM